MIVFRFRSVRVRLTAWYAAGLAGMLLLLLIGVHSLVQATFKGEIERRFGRSLTTVSQIIGDSPERLSWFDQHTTIDYFKVQLNGKDYYVSEEWREQQLDEELLSENDFQLWPWLLTPENFFRTEQRSFSTPMGNWNVKIAFNAAPLQDALQDLTANLMLALPIALIPIALGGYFMAGRVLSPVATMAEKVRQITAERLSERLPVDNPDDEFGKLALVINATLARLEDSFIRLRQFTQDASHELRTPLTAIRSVGEMGLAEPIDQAKCRDAIASMLEETDRLASLVEGLLVLTRADAGVIRRNLQTVNLREVADNVVELLNVLAEEKKQTILVDGADELFAIIDRGLLRQAVVNIIDNAIHHTPRGCSITVTVFENEAGMACISISDEGPGVAEEHRTRIFDRFFRADTSRTGGGAGLGLAIAKWAVEFNGGEIALDSRPGQGSTFTIILPVAKPKA